MENRQCCNHTLHSSFDHADEPFPYWIWVNLHVSYFWIQSYNLEEYYSGTVYVLDAQKAACVIRIWSGYQYLGCARPPDVCHLVIDMTPDRGRTDVNRQNETFLIETVLTAAHRSKFFPRYSSNRSRVLHGQVTLVLFTDSIYLCEVGGGGEPVNGPSDRRFVEVQHQLTHDWCDKEIKNIFSV